MVPVPVRKKIIVADDHISVREGLIQIIESCETLMVSTAVGNGDMLLKAVEQFNPDLVITDIRMPELDGLDAGIIMKEKWPGIGLIAYMTEENDFLFLKLLQAKFDGIVLKRASKHETVLAINMVLQGHEFYCHAAQERVNQLIRKKLYNPKRKTIKPFFSERELQILKRICQGQTSNEMAAEMVLSKRTINSYREKLLHKTGLLNPAGLVSFAYRAGIINDS